MREKLYPWTALGILTALNFFNYLDRSVLFAVQPLVQAEFHLNDKQLGFLSSLFFFCYMFAAPAFGWLADRYSRRMIVMGGIMVWSGATLLTAITYDYQTLLIRHTIVGIGEASYACIVPSLIADLFPEHHRGRVLSIFYIAIPVGTAAGYIVGGYLGTHYGWRLPFLIGAIPGFVLGLAMGFLPEPRRGSSDTLPDTPQRATILGLFRNPAFLTATLGMAMLTFALGGLQVWMPTFLSRLRNVPLATAGIIFGGITAFDGIVATLYGGWLGDRMLRRDKGAYYRLSGIGMAVGLPLMIAAIYVTGRTMYPSILLAEFFLLLNTGPLNAAIVNSVSASIRSTAIAVNLVIIHLLGDAFSPYVIGYISDRSSLQTGFIATVVAVGLSAVILFLGIRYAPELPALRMTQAGAD